MDFCDIVKELREDLDPKVSQSDLAKYMKTNQRKISRIETGQAEPNLEDLRMLCRFYNVSADFLLGFESPLPFPTRE